MMMQAHKEPTKKLEVVCDRCKKKKEITSNCDVCKQSYCESCTQKHNTNEETKKHLQASFGGTKIQESDIEQCRNVRGEYKATHYKHTPTTVPGDDKGAACTLGMVILPDGRLIVIDNRHKSLKLFNSDRYTYAFRRNFTHEPRGIAAISGKEIAITFADKHVVRMFLVREGSFEETGKFKVEEKPFNISYSEGNEKSLAIEVGEGKYGAIIITNLSGVVLKEISGYTRSFGLFTGNTIRLVHDHGKQLLFIADLTRNCVNCVDYDGAIVWKVEVDSPRGICHHGNTLFIASKSKNAIYQMKTVLGVDELPVVYLLLDSGDGIIEPRFLFYSAQAKRLAVEVAGNLIQTYNCSNRK
ncbi:uncharacterized protein LOC134695215 [Mytilus trossulus]|uniref:uncharacterized protein LOC134695215 n=1 Tax=Mytilus trossulus TaxID=6551 RepID=UPI003006B571